MAQSLGVGIESDVAEARVPTGGDEIGGDEAAPDRQVERGAVQAEALGRRANADELLGRRARGAGVEGRVDRGGAGVMRHVVRFLSLAANRSQIPVHIAVGVWLSAIWRSPREMT